MVTALDLNWLMSTAAQSAAAIVAIVGGFLVSRLIAANSEKAALRRRLQEVDLRVTRSTSDQAQAEASLLTFDATALIEDNVDFIMAKNGGATVDELLQRSPTTQWKEEKLTPRLSALLDDYAQAFTALSELPDSLLDREWKEVNWQSIWRPFGTCRIVRGAERRIPRDAVVDGADDQPSQRRWRTTSLAW